MIAQFKQLTHSVAHALFPHQCGGCGSDLLPIDEFLCYECASKLPGTNFHMHANNPVEKIFWGRIPLVYASSHLYFTKDSILQHLLHEFKYRGKREVGTFFGERMGQEILSTNRFSGIDAIIPLPLYKERERRRGYNQAEIISIAISKVIGVPVLKNAVIRPHATETQTKKGREERWQNIVGRFQITNSSLLEHKHLLLIDDVITTGATLESCGQTILTAKDTRLSIFSLAYTST